METPRGFESRILRHLGRDPVVPATPGGAVFTDHRPHLRSYQRRVTRRDRLRALAPFAALFVLGFVAAWLVKPAHPIVEIKANCTFSTVIPAKVLPKPASITVNVYNATKRVGLASITSIDVGSRGFRTGIVGSSSANIPGVGYIAYGPGSRPAAQRLAAYLPGVQLRQIARKPSDPSIDLVLGDAFNTLVPDQQAAAILSVPSPRASGKDCPVL